MKYILTLIFLGMMLFGIGCGKDDSTTVKNPNLATATVILPTAKCATCKKTITKAVKEQTGITDMKISGEAPAITAVISYDKTKTDEKAIFKTIAQAGYDAGGIPRDEKAYENLEECCK